MFGIVCASKKTPFIIFLHWLSRSVSHSRHNLPHNIRAGEGKIKLFSKIITSCYKTMHFGDFVKNFKKLRHEENIETIK